MFSQRCHAFAKEWLIPPAISRALRGCLTPAGPDRNGREILAANRPLEGRHRGGRVFILCSGPSIKTQDLTLLRNDVCIGVSNFFVHPDYAAINPRYHCIAPLHSPFTEEDGLRWFRTMEKPLAGKELFLSLTDRRLVQAGALFGETKVHYVSLGAPWREKPGESIDLAAQLPAAQSVSIFALMVALYLGFGEIYLLGTDHTSFNPQSGKYGYSHFYTGDRKNELGEMPPPADMEVEFASYVTLWRQYKALRAVAEQRGARIVNATRGGLLDVFPRVEFEGLFH
jgi:hypothetical protein